MNNLLSFYRQTLGRYTAQLALMALMIAPFLMNRRVGPQGGFVIEMTSTVIALVLVLGVCLMGYFRTKPPVISVMLFGFAALIAAQARIMQLSWLSQVDLTASVLLVAALCTWAVSSWQQQSPQSLFKWVAWALLLGVVLQTGVMWLQYLGLTKHFHGWVSYSASTNIMGQLGQRNHLGHYLMWGMVSVIYLKHTGAISRWFAALLVFWLGLSMGLIGSRTLIVYLIAISMLATVWRVVFGAKWTASLLWIMTALVWVLVVQLSFQSVLSFLNQAPAQTGIERLIAAGDAPVDSGRSVEWRKAWLSFLNSPLVGHGWAAYSSQSFLLHDQSADFLGRVPVGALFTHCHNSVLQLLSEVGLLGTLWIAGCLLFLVYRCLRYAHRPESFFILALVTVSICHSLLEYPLWYVYFLLPFMIFWSLVPTPESNSSSRLAFSKLNMTAALVCVVALAMCVRLAFAYNDILSVYGVAKNESTAIATEKKAKIHRLIEDNYLLDYYARMALIERSFSPYQGMVVADEVENARLVAEYRPYSAYATRWGMYQYRQGERNAGQKWLEQTWRYYPTGLNSNITQMQSSIWYNDLIPLAKKHCLEYQQKVKMKCPE